MGAEPPIATVICPSRGPASRLARLLDSLAEGQAPHETIVVDNASPDGEVTRCCEGYPSARAIRLDRNRGFSGPCNIAAAEAEAAVLVLLNDDCVVEPGFIAAIAAPIDPAAGIVMAAGVMREQRDPATIDSAGMELDPTLLVYDYLNGMPVSDLADSALADPVGPSAAAAAFDRDAYLAAGGFDETLFAYWEDVDLVIRLRLAGGRCVLARDAVGTHEHSATLGSGSPEKNRLMGFGRGYVLRKWGVLRSRRAPGALARETVLVTGQAAIDRNLAGLRGRLAGWRAFAGTPEPYPYEVAAAGGGSSLPRTLARRLARRRRLGAR
jgi:GT2 family glycosyltransferase